MKMKKKTSTPKTLVRSFAAWRTTTGEYFDASTRTSRLTATSPTTLANSRLTSSAIPPSKLDIHQRNQYNRVNHSSHIYNNSSTYSTTANNRIGTNNSNYHLPSSSSLLSSSRLDYHNHHRPSSLDETSTATKLSLNFYNNRTSSATQQSSSYQPSSSTQQSNYYSNSNNITSSSRSYLGDTIDPYVDEQAASDSRRFTERRKKTVRFDGQDSDEFSRWESERQGSQDSTTKDSGIDTSSTFTSSEDSNRGDGPKVVVLSHFSSLLCLQIYIFSSPHTPLAPNCYPHSLETIRLFFGEK